MQNQQKKTDYINKLQRQMNDSRAKKLQENNMTNTEKRLNYENLKVKKQVEILRRIKAGIQIIMLLSLGGVEMLNITTK